MIYKTPSIFQEDCDSPQSDEYLDWADEVTLLFLFFLFSHKDGTGSTTPQKNISKKLKLTHAIKIYY